MLQSSAFLYRPELGGPGAPGDVVRLQAHELASRLSFFLWSSVPDQELLETAETGGLETLDGVLSQADRMMADPKFGRTIRSFHAQWLGIARLDELGKDPVLYPEFDAGLGAAMTDETLTFAEYVLSEGEGTLEELLTASYSFLDEDLARLYGWNRSPAWGSVGWIFRRGRGREC